MPEILTLTKILKDAARMPYGVGSFSPRYTKMILPVVEAAIELFSPVIVQISEKEIARHKVSLPEFAAEFYHVVNELQPSVPLALHLDHTKTPELIYAAIDLKFTSVMIDASEHDFDTNVAITRQITEYAHARGVSVEAELGRIGSNDFVETDYSKECFTEPDEASRFCELTRADALAVSVGTAHGLYSGYKPSIRLELLRKLNKVLNTPLVLHGASDVPAGMVLDAVTLDTGGVAKVNIATDLEKAMLNALGESGHITDADLDRYGEAELLKARLAVRELVMDKMRNYLNSAQAAER